MQAAQKSQAPTIQNSSWRHAIVRLMPIRSAYAAASAGFPSGCRPKGYIHTGGKNAPATYANCARTELRILPYKGYQSSSADEIPSYAPNQSPSGNIPRNQSKSETNRLQPPSRRLVWKDWHNRFPVPDSKK